MEVASIKVHHSYLSFFFPPVKSWIFRLELFLIVTYHTKKAIEHLRHSDLLRSNAACISTLYGVSFHKINLLSIAFSTQNYIVPV